MNTKTKIVNYFNIKRNKIDFPDRINLLENKPENSIKQVNLLIGTEKVSPFCANWEPLSELGTYYSNIT